MPSTNLHGAAKNRLWSLAELEEILAVLRPGARRWTINPIVPRFPQVSPGHTPPCSLPGVRGAGGSVGGLVLSPRSP